MGAEAAATPLGSFLYRPAEDRWTWSDELCAIYGFAPGEVSPTTRLVHAHCHPEDRPALHDQLQEAMRTGRPTAGQHRLLDAGGGERWVALLVQPHEAAGSVWLEGHVLDLTLAHTRAGALLASDMLAAATESRAVIDVAKGALGLVYGLRPDAAFELLRWYSQHTQVRLRTLAERVVGAAVGPAVLPSGARRRVDGVLSATLRGEARSPGPIAAVPDPVPDPVPDTVPDTVPGLGPAVHGTDPGLSTEVVRLPGATFVRVSGEVDLRTTPELADALTAASAQTEAPAPVVVDLTEVGHLGSAGMDVLLACHRRCRAAGTELRLVVRPDGPVTARGADGPAVFADLASAAA